VAIAAAAREASAIKANFGLQKECEEEIVKSFGSIGKAMSFVSALMVLGPKIAATLPLP
jgi:hypothetical protein